VAAHRGRRTARRAQAQARRSCLAADAGANDEIARSVGSADSTIYRTKRRFVIGDLEAALNEEPRPGADRNLSGKEESRPWVTPGRLSG
jgi:hypothetical protein